MSDESRDHPFGRRANGRANGHDPDGMGTRPVPLDEVREPLDLVAVQADDELISALSAGLAVSAPGVHGYDADDHVAAMLAAWKADVDAAPIPEIDLDAAVDAVLAGSRPAARRPSTRMRHLVPVASAAALIVVAITGVSIAAHDTRPGDTLFPISKVLYAEEARSYEALGVVEQSREKARQALATGDKASAEQALAEGQAAADSVLAEHGRGEVEQKLHKLEVVVDDSEPGVPTVVKDDEPSRGGSGGAGSSSAQSQSSDPSQATTDPSATSEPGSGTDEPDPSATGTSQPRPTTSKPDPRAADAPPADPSGPAEPTGTAKPTATSEPTGTTGSGGSTGSAPAGSSEPEPPGTTKQPTEAGPPPAGEPEPTHSASAGPAATQDDPARPTSSAAPSAHRTAPGTGISGASMSATGTATPSGEPTA